MQLAKKVIDIGLSTNNLKPMLRFWQEDAGLRFDHVLPVRRGVKQYRHDAMGSVVKLNHYREPLPAAPPSGYHELVIAREGVKALRDTADPDGNRVCLVPPGQDGVTQIGVVVRVRSLDAYRQFYGDILGFPEVLLKRSVLAPWRQSAPHQGGHGNDDQSNPRGARLALHNATGRRN